jgi:hypothetical protein
MAEMIESTPQSRKRARLLHEIAFSIYFSLLLIIANAISSIQNPAGKSWVDELQFLIAGGRDAPSYHFAFGFLWATSTAVLFLCLRMLARLSFSDVFLRTFGGIVVVAGFPLTAGYVSFRGYLRMLSSFPRAFLYAYAPHRWLAIEVMATLVCIFLYVFLKWPTKARWGLFLLALHFVIWTWFVLIGGDESLIIFPPLGFLASLAWGLYARQPTASPKLPMPILAPQ